MKKKSYFLILLLTLFVVLGGIFIYMQFNQIKTDATYTIAVDEKNGLELTITDFKNHSEATPVIKINKEQVPVNVKYKLAVKVAKDHYTLSLTNLNSKTKSNHKHSFDAHYKYYGYVNIAKNDSDKLGYMVFTNNKDDFKDPQNAQDGQVYLLAKKIIR